MNGAERQARRRLRDALGLAVWGIEVAEHRTAAALIEAGFLEADKATSRKACCEAMARVVRIWADEILRDA
jgi:hypothetical protein